MSRSHCAIGTSSASLPPRMAVTNQDGCLAGSVEILCLTTETKTDLCSEALCGGVTESADSIVPNKVIVPDHKVYSATVDSLDEAHYLCAFLNSHPVRTWLGGFLIGKQIGTAIFEYMHVPRYNAHDSDHRRLVEISVAAHRERKGTRSKKYLSEKLERELERLVRKIAQAG